MPKTDKKHKNLGKYSTLYEEAGFTTVQFILPTRHIFRDTNQVPELMGQMMEQLRIQEQSEDRSI